MGSKSEATERRVRLDVDHDQKVLIMSALGTECRQALSEEEINREIAESQRNNYDNGRALYSSAREREDWWHARALRCLAAYESVLHQHDDPDAVDDVDDEHDEPVQCEVQVIGDDGLRRQCHRFAGHDDDHDFASCPGEQL